MFDQIQVSNTAVDIFNWLLSAGVVVLPLAIFAVLTFYGGEKAVYRFKVLLKTFRAMVDQPTDPLIVFLAKVAKDADIKPQELSDAIVDQIDAILRGMPGVVVQGTAVQRDLRQQEYARSPIMAITHDQPEPAILGDATPGPHMTDIGSGHLYDTPGG